jgi:hypothetical protein
MADKPLWRKGFDAVDRRVAGPAERAVRTDLFNDAIALGLRVQRRLQREAERRTRRALHTVNVPAASDVKRVSDQVAALQRQVRSLQHELERSREEPKAPARRRSRERSS